MDSMRHRDESCVPVTRRFHCAASAALLATVSLAACGNNSNSTSENRFNITRASKEKLLLN